MPTAHFHESEFKCHCGCGIQNVDLNLLLALETVRAFCGFPLVISSGCRCPTWNAHEGGAFNSAHYTTPTKSCQAADIRCLYPRTRFQIFKAALAAGITRMGMGPDFIHLDISPVNDPEVIWDYYPRKKTGGT